MIVMEEKEHKLEYDDLSWERKKWHKRVNEKIHSRQLVKILTKERNFVLLSSAGGAAAGLALTEKKSY